MAKKKKSKALEDAWTRWKDNGSPESRKALFEVAEPVIQSTFSTYVRHVGSGGEAGKRKREEFPVLNLKARELAQKAFDTYDPDRRAGLSTHLRYQMKPLIRELHERANPLKIPHQAWWDMRNLNQAEDKYRDASGKEPTAARLADETGLSQKRIAYLRQFRREAIPDSALMKTDPRAAMATKVLGTDDENDWAEQAVYYSLGDVDKRIMEGITGMFGGEVKSGGELARELGISGSAVSQRRKKIGDMLLEATQDQE